MKIQKCGLHKVICTKTEKNVVKKTKFEKMKTNYHSRYRRAVYDMSYLYHMIVSYRMNHIGHRYKVDNRIYHLNNVKLHRDYIRL